MARVELSESEYIELLRAAGRLGKAIATHPATHEASKGIATGTIVSAGRGRSKRKASAYSKEYGRQYKALKKKHPRMKFGALSKKAHAATRRAMK